MKKKKLERTRTRPRLTLNKETVRNLTDDDMASAVGGLAKLSDNCGCSAYSDCATCCC
jgi:hypothetical protein